MQPLLEHPPGVLPYPRGSWGPEDAETLVRGHPRWHDPWLAATADLPARHRGSATASLRVSGW